MVAKEWYLRGQTAQDSFDSLSNYWRGFNHLYAPHLGNSERVKIREFLRLSINEAQAQEILKIYAAEIDYLISLPINDMRDQRRNTSAYIQSFIQQGRSDLEKLQEVFMMIYQVRCNFEHGQKSPTNDRDSKLCQAACPIVAYVLNLTAP
jgi:hypothetical protein